MLEHVTWQDGLEEIERDECIARGRGGGGETAHRTHLADEVPALAVEALLHAFEEAAVAEEVCGAAGGYLVPGVVAVAALALDEVRGGGVFGFVEELGDGAVVRDLLVACGLGDGGDLCVEFVVASRNDAGFDWDGPTGPAEEAGEAEAPGFEGDFGEGCTGAGVIAVVFCHDGADSGFREAFEFLVTVCETLLSSCRRRRRRRRRREKG